MSFPDCSIAGVKPMISAPPPGVRTTKSATCRRCCVCGAKPTKVAKYPIQGAVIV